ncbi:protein SSUH2 homolog [Phaethornis superciliosus]
MAKNNIFEFVSEHHLNCPGELLSKVSRQNIFRDEKVVVHPILDFSDPQISLASQSALAEHPRALTTSCSREGPAALPPLLGLGTQLLRHWRSWRRIGHFIIYLEVIFSK